ncbi:hypothetical protein HIM_09682 [Hirsutella minnesotensis 3608]|uniref:Tautomerase cis-CaaD-like domain-containing protein n=1 Tax=Hirsutella minnesotensis 3608 TaxID=1043627 RepID=A0A0F7ZGI1_9HYPO|nr:hypothetical protein HIM_09682 [Hirsutella minnesotensis 3608]
MPHWLVFHPVSTFETEESKAALAKDITSYYTDRGMPAFYVVMHFVKLGLADTFVGGEPKNKGPKPFIRLVAEHINVRLPDADEAYARTIARLEARMKPHIADKGYDWEIHIDETERRLWRINGIYPPPFQSADERVWALENRPVPEHEMEEARKRITQH